MAKLTKAQRRFLVSLNSGGIHCLDMGSLAGAMAARLKDEGLIERYFRGFGQWGYRITDAGRAALSRNVVQPSRS